MADGGNDRKVNALAIGAALAALGVGGGGIGIMGNQSSTATELSELRVEIAALKVLMADEEKRMIARIAATDESTADRFRRGRADMDGEIDTIRETVHELELDFARIHGHNPRENP